MSLYASTSVIWIFGLFATVAAANSMHFEERVLADDLAGGYQVVACDVNGDGKLDLIALASDMTDLVWFENPSWERRVLATNLPHLINLACWNHSAHAPPTIAVAYEFSMHPEKSVGIVALLTVKGDPRRPCKATEIDRLPASHRLRWADIDGSGKKVLINAPLAANRCARAEVSRTRSAGLLSAWRIETAPHRRFRTRRDARHLRYGLGSQRPGRGSHWQLPWDPPI
jgi:hypothetical protein